MGKVSVTALHEKLTWRERRRLRLAQVKLTPLEACDEAIKLLKEAGFEFVTTSMKSHTCYYRFPGRYGVLRVSTHSKGKANILFASGPTYASVTFSHGQTKPDGKLHLSPIHIENAVSYAIGVYMLNSGRDGHDRK